MRRNHVKEAVILFNAQQYICGLSSTDPQVREDSLAVLSHAGITGQEDKICQLLAHDDNKRVRKEAAMALEIFKNPAATDVLIVSLHDEYWGVRLHAYLALMAILSDAFQQNQAITEALETELNHYVLHVVAKKR